MMERRGRTIVRDPRKQTAAVQRVQDNLPAEHDDSPPPPPMQPQQPGLGSYMLMGAGMSLGFALVGALFGGF